MNGNDACIIDRRDSLFVFGQFVLWELICNMIFFFQICRSMRGSGEVWRRGPRRSNVRARSADIMDKSTGLPCLYTTMGSGSWVADGVTGGVSQRQRSTPHPGIVLASLATPERTHPPHIITTPLTPNQQNTPHTPQDPTVTLARKRSLSFPSNDIRAASDPFPNRTAKPYPMPSRCFAT